MGTTKRIVCLANSRKMNGRCVAGKAVGDSQTAEWVRPVSAREHQEVSENERQYEDGSDPQVLDVIDVPLLDRSPKAYQPENWLLDPKRYWEKVGTISWNRLSRFSDPVEPLWTSGHSTFHGKNDFIPLVEAETVSSSLKLLGLARAQLLVFAPSEAFGDSKRRVQAQFRHADIEYRTWVTDPVYNRRFLSRPNGEYELGECYFTVSLGEPFNDNCYKLVAAIIERPVQQEGTR